MQQVPAEAITIARASALFWATTFGAILVAGRWRQGAHDFSDRMLRQWKPSLVITLLYALGMGMGGKGFFPVYAIAIFCQAMIGLTLAYSIAGFEPLPVTQAVVHQEQRTEEIALTLVTAIAVVIAALAAGSLLWSVLMALVGETASNPQEITAFFPNPGPAFFLLLAGAGIAEESIYRLVCVSLLWRLTHRPWAAITISAVLFGAYHLSPVDALYRQYWERPITVFVLSTVMGVVMGYVYVKRGYETAVLGHTLGDWMPYLLSRAG